jgi:hypothetical protein
MSEAAPQYSIRVTIEKISRGNMESTNYPLQSVGNGITIMSASGAVNVESPMAANIEINDSQVTGLLGYIGLLNATIDTSAIETAIATLVAAS